MLWVVEHDDHGFDIELRPKELCHKESTAVRLHRDQGDVGRFSPAVSENSTFPPVTDYHAGVVGRLPGNAVVVGDETGIGVPI